MATIKNILTPVDDIDRLLIESWGALKQMKKSYYALKYHIRNKTREELEHLVMNKPPAHLGISRGEMLMYMYLTHPRIVEDTAWYVVESITNDVEDVDEDYQAFLDAEKNKTVRFN